MDEFFKPVQKMTTKKNTGVAGAAAAAKPHQAAAFPWEPIKDAKFEFPHKGRIYDQSEPFLVSDEKMGVTIGYAVRFTTDFNPPHPLPVNKKGDIRFHSQTGQMLNDVTGYFPIPEKFQAAK